MEDGPGKSLVVYKLFAVELDGKNSYFGLIILLLSEFNFNTSDGQLLD